MAKGLMTLSEYLSEVGKKPSAFAESLGMPASTIIRIINGQREARIGTAAKIVAATGGKVTFEELVHVPPAATVRASA